jgi:hypothetical protein
VASPVFASARVAAAVAVASTCAFAGLVAAAASLARLPPPGFSIASRGAPAELDVAHASVTVDEPKGTAWLVASRAACAVDLARGAFVKCLVGPSSRRAPRHLAAGDAMLVVEDDPKSARDAVAFEYAVLDERGRVRKHGVVSGGAFPDAWAHGASQTNVGWDAGERSFVVAFDWTDGADRQLVRVPIDTAGNVGEPRATRATVGGPVARAIFGLEDLRVLGADRVLHVDGTSTPLAIRASDCKGAASITCVAVQGDAPPADASALAAFVTADGRAIPAAELVGAAPARGARLFEVVTAPGKVAAPRAAVHTRPEGCASAACERVSIGLSGGASAAFEVRAREGESVLVASRAEGPIHRVARGASSIDAWTFVPFSDGLLAIDAKLGRAVVLDADLAPVDPEPSAGDLGAKLRERYARGDLDLKLAALALVTFLPLLALVVRAALRARRGAASPRAVLALAAWTLCTAALLALRAGALFAP